MQSFVRIAPSDEELRRVQDNAARVLDAVVRSRILDGALLEDVELVSGQANDIHHKLLRSGVKWLAVSPSANAVIWEDTDNDHPEIVIRLRCSANVTTDLWVF